MVENQKIDRAAVYETVLSDEIRKTLSEWQGRNQKSQVADRETVAQLNKLIEVAQRVGHGFEIKVHSNAAFMAKTPHGMGKASQRFLNREADGAFVLSLRSKDVMERDHGVVLIPNFGTQTLNLMLGKKLDYVIIAPYLISFKIF